MNVAEQASSTPVWMRRSLSAVVPTARAARTDRIVYRPLGAYRALLAGMVAAHHYAIHLAPGYGKAVVQSLELGRMAVLLFFVLSGFVICEAVATFYQGRPIQFIANRMLRIVPPFAAVLAASCVIEGALLASGLLHPLEGGPVSAADLGPGNCLGNLLSILPGLDASVLRPRYDIDRYIWAIRVEVVFYLVVFGCAALTAWRGGQRRERAGLGLGTWLGLAGLTLSVSSVAAKAAGHGTGAFEFAPYFTLGGAWFYIVSGNTLGGGSDVPRSF